LRALSAKADGVGVGGGTQRTNFDIVAAGRDVVSRLVADSYVRVGAVGVCQRCPPSGGIVVTRGVENEGLVPTGDIAAACGVGVQSLVSSGGIVATRGVAVEGLGSGGCIEATCGVV
jgi:hypothetical protein